MDKQKMSGGSYENEYIPSVVKWGRFTNLVGVLLGLAPAAVLTFIYGIHPPMQAVLAGIMMVASIEFVFWFVEPIAYFPVLGLPATYMSFLSGNIGNLRMPVSAAAQTAAKVEQGSKQGNIIATIGVAVSIIVNVAILTLGVIMGAQVLASLPENINAALSNIVPALFGALLAQQVVNNFKIGLVGICMAGGMILLGKFGMLNWVPGDYTFVVMIVSVFGTMLVGKMLSPASKEEESK